MKLVFICQVVDQNHPIMATAVRLIEEFSKRPQLEWMMVISLRKGIYKFRDNVEVRAIQGRNCFITLARFYREVVRAVFRGVDGFFIYQGGPYPLLLLIFKLLMGIPIYQWKAHPYISFAMRFYARFCITKIFTSTRNAFPMKLSKIRVIGQGVDTSQFRVKRLPKTGELVTIGRIMPVKRLDQMLKALAECNRRYGTSYRLDIYGPTISLTYRSFLDSLINELNISASVIFHDSVSHNKLPDILNQYTLFLSFAETALDRSVVETMACGLPVITPNPCVEEILTYDLKKLLIVSKKDLVEQAERIHRILSLDKAHLSKIGQSLRKIIVQNHSIDSQIYKILSEME